MQSLELCWSSRLWATCFHFSVGSADVRVLGAPSPGFLTLVLFL